MRTVYDESSSVAPAGIGPGGCAYHPVPFPHRILKLVTSPHRNGYPRQSYTRSPLEAF
jgi:hypothetical protein